MSWGCKLAAGAFVLLWVGALVVWLIGLFGLFGAAEDPVAGIFLLPLGLPWSLGVELVPGPSWPWLAVIAPGVNLLLLLFFCRRGRPSG